MLRALIVLVVAGTATGSFLVGRLLFVSGGPAAQALPAAPIEVEPGDRPSPAGRRVAGRLPATAMALAASPGNGVLVEPTAAGVKLPELTEFDRQLLGKDSAEAASATRGALVLAASMALRQEPTCFQEPPDGPTRPVFQWDVEVRDVEVAIRGVHFLQVVDGAPLPPATLACILARLARIRVAAPPLPGTPLLAGYRGTIDIVMPIDVQVAAGADDQVPGGPAR